MQYFLYMCLLFLEVKIADICMYRTIAIVHTGHTAEQTARVGKERRFFIAQPPVTEKQKPNVLPRTTLVV